MPTRMPPFSVTWEITSRCNAGCVYCGSHSFSERNELSTIESLDVVAQLKDIGVSVVTIIGGEPLLRADLFQIIRKLRKAGIEVCIVSNGSLLNKKKIEGLKALGMLNVSISLDGSRKYHDALRKGAPFNKAVESLKKLVSNKIPASIITTIQKQNFDFQSLEHLFWLKNSLGLNSWRIQVAIPIGRMNPNSVLSPHEYHNLSEWIVEKNKKSQNQIFVGDNIGFCDSNTSFLRNCWSGCGAGLFSLGITPAGNIKGCVAMPNYFIEGSLRKLSLKEIWYNKNSFPYNRHFSLSNLSGKCKGCVLGKECRGGCRSFSIYKNGKFESLLCNYFFEKTVV